MATGETHTFLIRIINTQKNKLIPRWNAWLQGETHTFLIRIINTQKNIPRMTERLLGETHTLLIRIINTKKNKLIPSGMSGYW